MSKLFIELYLDEDVDVLIAELIRARGFSATTTVEAGQLHNDDDAQLAYTVTHDKTFVTHNRADFETRAQAYFAAGLAHPGIIIAARRSPYEIAQRLLVILNNVTDDEIRNQVRYIEYIQGSNATSNKSLHRTLGNVGKIRKDQRVFRVAERARASWSASELGRSAHIPHEGRVYYDH